MDLTGMEFFEQLIEQFTPWQSLESYLLPHTNGDQPTTPQSHERATVQPNYSTITEAMPRCRNSMFFYM